MRSIRSVFIKVFKIARRLQDGNTPGKGRLGLHKHSFSCDLWNLAMCCLYLLQRPSYHPSWPYSVDGGEAGLLL